MLKNLIEISKLTPYELSKWIISAIIVVTAFISLYKYLEKYRKTRNEIDDRNSDIDRHTEDIKSINSLLEANMVMMSEFKEVLIELMHDRISQKCRFYISKGYIPDDERDDFNRQWGLYHYTLKGNHGLGDWYKKAKDLPYESEFKKSREHE